jgi:hypothetical protein
MAKRSDGPALPADSARATRRRQGSRWTTLGLGVVLGFVWGCIMWGLVTVFGQNTGGVRGWLYIALSMAMIGGGVAGVFGAAWARKGGERISPRFRRR